jgi:hypothetical protein
MDADDKPASREPNLLPGTRVGYRTRLIGGLVGMVAGGLLLLGGIILHVGEKADRLFIFPWAGRLTMLVGMVVLGIGAASAGRRAAMSVAGFMVAVGIAVYVIGLVYVEQLGTRLYQAFGLLTALVGLMALYFTYGMESNGPLSGPGESNSSESA